LKIGINSSWKFWTNLVPHLYKMGEFSHFNQILLNLFDVLNAFVSQHRSKNELNDVNN